ncbi:MAG: rod shape-determining protein RodA [Lysobacterales bacterium CG02_land_8_20_14_3_00_62_12]|nr:MAG: rod shape-determining protein RodA [Xanthomonadales bacterium CG02_land_8_20_14_3_00_62_12]
MWKVCLLGWWVLGFGSVLADESLPRSAAPADAVVYLISPKAGEKIHGDVVVRFGLKGMGVAPAGVNLAGTGHHHLLLDVAALPDLNLPLPKDAQHLHFGAGQTETTLKLPAGKHTLQLLLGDQLHIPHQPPVVSEKVTITVE